MGHDSLPSLLLRPWCLVPDNVGSSVLSGVLIKRKDSAQIAVMITYRHKQCVSPVLDVRSNSQAAISQGHRRKQG